MKASLLINLPSLSRKWDGLKVCGLSHSLSSYRTEVSRGSTVVPCMQRREQVDHIKSHNQSTVTDMKISNAFLCIITKLWVSNLFDKVALEGDVLTGFVRNCHGGNVGESLWFVDDCVSVGEALSVLHLDLTASNHPAQLLLDLIWTRMK